MGGLGVCRQPGSSVGVSVTSDLSLPERALGWRDRCTQSLRGRLAASSLLPPSDPLSLGRQTRRLVTALVVCRSGPAFRVSSVPMATACPSAEDCFLWVALCSRSGVSRTAPPLGIGPVAAVSVGSGSCAAAAWRGGPPPLPPGACSPAAVGTQPPTSRVHACAGFSPEGWTIFSLVAASQRHDAPPPPLHLPTGGTTLYDPRCSAGASAAASLRLPRGCVVCSPRLQVCGGPTLPFGRGAVSPSGHSLH